MYFLTTQNITMQCNALNSMHIYFSIQILLAEGCVRGEEDVLVPGLLVNVDLDAAGGGVDAAPARPAERDGHHAVHVGQQDGHSDGDRQPRHQRRHEDLTHSILFIFK